MRVVSWNVAKRLGKDTAPFNLLVAGFERWGADAVLIQEPTQYMINKGGDPTTPRGCKGVWTTHVYPGGVQGTIVVMTRGDTTVQGRLQDIGDFGLGQGTKRIDAENPLVSLTLQKDNELLTFATCHAPFDNDIRTQFIKKAVDKVADNDIDVFMGDMNTYGFSMPGNPDTKANYIMGLASPTGGQGTGGPLDKIIMKNKYRGAKRGRIVPQNPVDQIHQPVRGAPNGDGVQDLTDPGWGRQEDGHQPVLIPSDHLPVYLETDGDANLEVRPTENPEKKRPRNDFFAKAEEKINASKSNKRRKLDPPPGNDEMNEN